MNLSTMISRLDEQLRLSPLVEDTDVVMWLQQAIQHFCYRSQCLEGWVIISCKEDIAKYLLPADHQVTTAAYYDDVKLQPCTNFDSEFSAATTPVYYYEDNWEDAASDAEEAEFAKHYALQELWPFQLMRSQDSHGRKTITLVDAPAADGTESEFAQLGGLRGTIEDTTIYWASNVGTVYYAATSAGNLILFYRKHDRLPKYSDEDIDYNDALAILYSCQTLSGALGTEDDDYDRYRSWLYAYIADSIAGLLRGIFINKRII